MLRSHNYLMNEIKFEWRKNPVSHNPVEFEGCKNVQFSKESNDAYFRVGYFCVDKLGTTYHLSLKQNADSTLE